MHLAAPWSPFVQVQELPPPHSYRVRRIHPLASLPLRAVLRAELLEEAQRQIPQEDGINSS